MNGILYITGALADGGVTTVKIANDAVTNTKIADNTIVTGNLANDAVTTDKIADNAINSSKLAIDSVTNTIIADDTIVTGNIVDDAVTAAKIADGAIDNSAKIGGNVINNTHMADNAINTAEIASNAVTTAKIADEAVTLAKLPHGTSSNDGKFLRANNGADPTFETVSGTTINSNADNRIITGSSTANTLNAESEVLFDATTSDFSIIGSQANRVMDLIVQNTHNGGAAAGARLTLESGSNANTGPQLGFRCGTHTWYLQVPKAAGNLEFNNNDTGTNFLMADDGDFHINDGDLVIGTSGHGIDFSATSHASGMSSELLDSYEEGTWTPSINVGSYTTFLSHQYIKIGRLVHLHGGFLFNNNTSGTRVEISGIPFSSTASQYVGNVWLRRTSTGEKNYNMILGEAGQNKLSIHHDSNGGHNDMGGHLSYSNFGSSATYFNYSITYMAAS